MTARILVVDDEDRIRRWLVHLLSKQGFEVADTGQAADALHRLTLEEFDIVIMDLNMPGFSGFDGIRSIKLIRENQKIAVLTGMSPSDAEKEALEAGADIILFKPCRSEKIIAAMQQLLNNNGIGSDEK